MLDLGREVVALTTTGVVCDLRGLNAISIAADGRTVTAGAGCLLIDLVTALAARGLAVPSGSCPTVGLGGLALGGGVGLASRAFGTTSDNVLEVRLVTADGRLRVAGPDADQSTVNLANIAQGGLGLGFFIAKTLLERSGASLAFLNRQPPAQGAVVHVRWTREGFEVAEASQAT